MFSASFGKGNNNLNKFFLACDCKPGTNFFKLIDGFTYDIIPARIPGTLGVINYEPDIYSITTIEGTEWIYGYIMTITHEDTIELLDRVKGFYGNESLNYHTRVSVKAETEEGNEYDSWAYLLYHGVLASFESIEQVQDGIWDGDQKLEELRAILQNEEDENDEDE